jgi:hypothetical protein
MNNNWRTAMTISETQSSTKDNKSATQKCRVSKTKKANIGMDNDLDIRFRIEVAAYFRALARGFAPGHELDDWLAAEKEADQ